MTRDEFDGWRKDVVTQWVFKALTKAADAERAEWVRQSWDEGKADLGLLTELRTRAATLNEMMESFETYQMWNGEQDD